jgi:hypothetical protein
MTRQDEVDRGDRQLRRPALPRPGRAAHLSRPPGRRRRAARAPRARAPEPRASSSASAPRPPWPARARSKDKSRVVARVASKLFAAEIPESNVIVETLERVTDPSASSNSVTPALGPAIDAGIPPTISDAELSSNIRCDLGRDPPRRHLVRGRSTLGPCAPADGDEAAPRSARTLVLRRGRAAALRDAAPDLELPERDRTRPRRSQRTAASSPSSSTSSSPARGTPSPPSSPPVSAPSPSTGSSSCPAIPDKRLYPVHFCRECGHEYHPVASSDAGDRTLPRARHRRCPARAPTTTTTSAEDDTDDPTDREVFGFVTPIPRLPTSRSTIATRTTPRPGSSTTRLAARASRATTAMARAARSTSSPPMATSARA